MAGNLDWFQQWDRVLEWEPPFAKWFVGGKLNLSHNCLDRHLGGWRKNKAAIIWEGEPGDSKILTYQQLHREVCRFANVLKALGAQARDRVVLYMPMIPELPIAMLACARIGATHSVVFGGFSSEALRERINDCQAKLVVTADGGFRRGRDLPLKANVDEALPRCPSVQKQVVVKRTGRMVEMTPGRDFWWHEQVAGVSECCPAEILDAEHPLFILYTSGTTGKPKGVVHTTGGYLTGVHLTTSWIFDLHEEDTYWCTADIGWVTGHRLGTMEIESALVSHPAVAEAAVVGRPDEIKGYAIAAFVTLESGHQPSEVLKEELRTHVAKEIGALARPDMIRFTEALPKTRSGKIMRRLLRDIASGSETTGDTTTLEDLSVLAHLREEEE